MPKLPDGWNEYPADPGHRGAEKWFGDHYKRAVVLKDGGDLAQVCAELDRESALRETAAADANAARAAELRAEADALSPEPKKKGTK